MTTAVDEQRRDAFAERVFTASIATLEMLSIYLGDRLGFYRALSDGGTATSSELAARAGTHERYTREWLEQQAVAGIVEADGGDGPLSRRYALDRAHAEVLADPDSLSYLVPLARLTASPGHILDTLVEAYRTGAGVAWSAYGEDARLGQAAINRPAFLQLLGSEWLPAVPDVHARLRGQPRARVADIGCGEGWSAIGIAQAYPDARVDGFDLDEPSLARAREHAAEAGLAGRVRFEARDAASAAFEGRYDLVTIFEALHDMARPVEALRAARGMLTPGGVTIVVDERVAEQFTAPGDEIERMMYGWSVLICLANSMTEQPSAATGTVMRPDVLREYALAAGYASVEVLPIENELFRFYRLNP